jgi:hypothetical protein
MITALNTSFNRKLKLVDANGKILALKSGVVYFHLKTEDGTIYYRCEENLFNKNFEQTAVSDLKELDEEEWILLRKKCKVYP